MRGSVRRFGWIAGVAISAVLAIPAISQAQVWVDETCPTAYLKSDAAAANVAFPDENATYWLTPFAAVPGTRLRIDGRFPHARYISFNSYDNMLRPVDVLTDAEIAPDEGHLNPFLPGARRDRPRRSYTAYVEFGPAPADPVPNTLYTGNVQAGLVIYRVYVPDRGYLEDGGVGVPTISAEVPATGSAPRTSPCVNANQPFFGLLHPLNELVASFDGVPWAEVLPIPGSDPPGWRKFDNLPSTVINAALRNGYTGALADALSGALPDTGSGGFLSNIDNAYVASINNRAHGRVLVTKMRAPTAPATRSGPRRMPRGQLRYFSVCTNEFITQRYFDCAFDEQIVTRGKRRTMTFVTSSPGDRPEHARRRCGVNWLRNGPIAESVLIYRHMLPRPGFRRSIQVAEVDDEQRTMKGFFPRSRYFESAEAYDQASRCGGG